jgi:hypothetical protein
MNERYAVDPDAIHNSRDLRNTLEKFGPHAGRYLSALPAAWFDAIRSASRSWSDLEAARASALLHRALEDRRVLREKLITNWRVDKPWLENVRPLVASRPAKLEAAVVDDLLDIPTDVARVVHLEDLQLPPAADERILATVDEYRRVCSVLLRVSHEAFLVDPYLDPTNRDHADVLAALWQEASNGPCQRMVVWASTKRLLRRVRPTSLGDIELALKRIAPRAHKTRPALEMRLADDTGAPEAMHGRYLLSIYGGVRLERGFQCFRKAKVDVSPVSSAGLLNQLLAAYKDAQQGLHIDHCIAVP